MRLRYTLATFTLLALSATPALAVTTTNLYVADYGKGNGGAGSDLLQYTATLVGGQEVLTQVLPTLTILPPAGGAITEGINGTANDIITLVKTSGGSYELARYNDNGTFNSYIGGGATTFASAGSFIVSNDASTVYVADQNGGVGGKGELYEVSLATGLVENKVALASVHDVAILPNGNVVAEDLNSGSSLSGIVEYNSSLGTVGTLDTSTTPGSTGTSLIVQGTTGEAEPASTPGNLQGHNQYGYAVDNVAGSPYLGDLFTTSDDRSGGPGNATGTSGTLYAFTQAGVYVASWTPSPVVGTNLNVGTFGISFGPDGNLYFANLGGVVLGDNAGNQVSEFNVSTATFSTYINGNTSGLVNVATGLSAPKYLNWQTDFSPGNDPGYTTPEPSGAVTSGIGIVILGLLKFGSSKRIRRASQTVIV